ncbi:hypothetical protein [Azonexus sp. IMCC34839]|uniref:hypothetical protein n=1 Tax=Azonexus sp. IMCC34839 TaxID=3133695 RepID=UPI00399C06CD
MARLYVYEGKRHKTYYTIDRNNKYINLGRDLPEAKRKLLELEDEAPARGTVADYLSQLMASRLKLVRSNKLAQSTYDSNELEIIQLNKAFGKMDPAAIRPTHIWKYLHEFRGSESPVRANREIALLSTMFNRLIGSGVVDINPCNGVERNNEVSRTRLVTDAEFVEFLKFSARKSEAGMRMALAAYIAYLTGKAQGQILKLTRHAISSDGITFGARKRGSGTLVEWTPRLRRMVRYALSMPCSITPLFVIHTRAGTPYTSDGFKSNWQRLMNEWCALGNERFTFHDLRAKAVTDMIDQGRKASDLTGHRQEATISRVYDRRRLRKSKAVR